MDYKSPTERFDLAERTIEDLRAVATTLQEVGSYSAQDETALKMLILNLANAMNILDPGRSDHLLKQKAKEYLEEHGEVDPEASTSPVGQYL